MNVHSSTLERVIGKKKKKKSVTQHACLKVRSPELRTGGPG